MKVKKIEVACAIIEQDGRVMAAQRSEAMSLPLKWEFPGGKIEARENPQICLERELWEELRIRVEVLAELPPSDWCYPDFFITLHPFVCRIQSGTIQLTEHKAIDWVRPADLWRLDWAAADGPVLENYRRYRAQELSRG